MMERLETHLHNVIQIYDTDKHSVKILIHYSVVKA